MDKSIHVVCNSCACPFVSALPSLSRLLWVLNFELKFLDGSVILNVEI